MYSTVNQQHEKKSIFSVSLHCVFFSTCAQAAWLRICPEDPFVSFMAVDIFLSLWITGAGSESCVSAGRAQLKYQVSVISGWRGLLGTGRQ